MSGELSLCSARLTTLAFSLSLSLSPLSPSGKKAAKTWMHASDKSALVTTAKSRPRVRDPPARLEVDVSVRRSLDTQKFPFCHNTSTCCWSNHHT